MANLLANENGVTITAYTKAPGVVSYQVTWGMDRWVCFDDYDDATAFMALLHKATSRA